MIIILVAYGWVEVPSSGRIRAWNSGDLGRVDEDGNINCLGRTDHQVKVRGNRVNLLEIEAAMRGLISDAGFSDLVVVAFEVGGITSLGAALAPETGDLKRLRKILSDTLVSYMIPSKYLILPVLPRGATGKMDREGMRKQLASMTERSEQGTEICCVVVPNFLKDVPYAPPRNSTEKEMITIWEDIFRISGIGIDDDFFSLGGDSITGIRVVSRAQKSGIQLETHHLFECYTIRQIVDKYSAVLSAISTVDQHVSQIVEKSWIERFPEPAMKEALLKGGAEIEDVYHMTPVQEGNFFFVVTCAYVIIGMLFHSLLHPYSEQYMPQLVWKLDLGHDGTKVDLNLLKKCWQTILHRHPIFRFVFFCPRALCVCVYSCESQDSLRIRSFKWFLAGS